MKSLKSIRSDNVAATRKSRRDERVWAPGFGWLSATQQKALRDICRAGAGTGWVPIEGFHRHTLAALERRGFVRWPKAYVRLTDAGLVLVRGWQEAEDEIERVGEESGGDEC